MLFWQKKKKKEGFPLTRLGQYPGWQNTYQTRLDLITRKVSFHSIKKEKHNLKNTM
jgi:hypothetical protein